MNPSFKSLVPKDELKKLNQDVYDRGLVDREHMMQFLALIPTNDGDHIIQEVKNWLYNLHNDPKYDKVVFPKGHIEAVISDLDSYGRVQPSTILKYKEQNGRELPVT